MHHRSSERPSCLLYAWKKPSSVFANWIFFSAKFVSDTFQSIVSFLPLPPSYLPHSHFVLVCLFHREINQGLIGKEVVPALYILVSTRPEWEGDFMTFSSPQGPFRILLP